MAQSNPFAAMDSASTPSPAPQATSAPAPAAQPSNPFAAMDHPAKMQSTTHPKPHPGFFQSIIAPFVPIVRGEARALGTGINTVFDVLNRPHEAVTAAVTGGVGKLLPTLVHGQSQASQNQTRAELRKKIGIEPLYESIGQHPVGLAHNARVLGVDLGHSQQGVIDLLLDTLTDPLTYAGGSGLIKKGVETAGRAGLVRFAGALDKAERAGGETAKVGGIAAKAFDRSNFKGAAKLALMKRFGTEGIDQHAGLTAINNVRLGHGRQMAQAFTRELHQIVHGLSPEDEAALYTAIHTGTTGALKSSDLRTRAQQFSDLTDTLAYLSGTRKLRAQLEQEGFALPQWAKRFDTQVRSLQRPSQYRKDYVPTMHDLDTTLAQRSQLGSLAELDARTIGQSAEEAGLYKDSGPFRRLLNAVNGGSDASAALKKTKPLDEVVDPNLKPRSDQAHLLNDPDMQRRVIEARLRVGAKALSARDAEREAARLFGVGGFAKIPTAAQEFFRETYTSPLDRSGWQNFGNYWKSAIDIPKVALFALPFRHGMNIATLSIFADPSLANVFGTVGRYARLLLARGNPERYADVLGKSAKYGATEVPSFDRQTASGWIGKVPGVGDLYKATNHLLWTFDDAAKATRFDRLLKGYQKQGLPEPKAAYRAAADVGAELIDYSNNSPLTKALSYILPFATYRTKIPTAILRTATQHPERALAAGRMSPELVGDEQRAPGGKAGKSYLPLPEVLRGVENPFSYARSSAGYPVAMLLSGVDLKAPHYFTYGKPPDWKYLLNATLGTIPGAQFGLDKLHLGEFANQGDIGGTIRSQSGFGLVSAPTQRQIEAAQHVEVERKIIGNLRRHGYNHYADALQKRLDAYLQYSRPYEP